MKGRILIVDHDRSVSSTVEFHLRAAGHETETAGSPEEAVQRVREFGPDVALVESHLPGMRALELIQLLNEAGKDLPVIVAGARRSLRHTIEAIRGGAYDYLAKPLDMPQLDSVLARCLRDGSARRRRDPEPDEEPDLVVGTTPPMLDIYRTIAHVSQTSVSVLIRGETGTGKELIARSIHRHSVRANEPFVAVNCAALPETLLESELFGHVKGAFTGAMTKRRGRFESTGGGTIFLDEIGDTSPAFQSKLLRVLQDGEFYPVGSESPRRSEARVLAATHQNIEQLVRQGRFREDLYFRLRVVEILVPPLRERVTDIPLLARHFLARAAREMQKSVRFIPPDAMRTLEEHDWPGNVRELENAIVRAVALAQGAAIHAEDLDLDGPSVDTRGQASGDASLSVLSMDGAEREQVERVLQRTGGNKRQAARTLKISRGRLDRLIEKHRIDLDDFVQAQGMGD